VPRPSPLGAGAAQASGSGGKRPAREAAKKAGKRTKVVAMEAELGEWLRPITRLECELMYRLRSRRLIRAGRSIGGRGRARRG
jgi:hypothetical protein